MIDLRDTCVALGMDFDDKDPTAIVHSNHVVPSIIESTLSDVYGLITKQGEQILLIVILPDVRNYDAKVEEACKNLGVLFQCCLPQHAKTLSIQYVNNIACKINKKVLECRWFDSCEKMKEEDDKHEICSYIEDFRKYDDFGRGGYGASLDGWDARNCDVKVEETPKTLSSQYLNNTAHEINKVLKWGFDSREKMEEDDDSSVICGYDEDLIIYDDLGRGVYGASLDGSDMEVEDNDSSDSSDSEMSQYDDSLDDSDSEMVEYADSGILSDVEANKTKQFDETKEDEGYHEETQFALGYSTPEEKPEALQIEGRSREKLPLPMSGSLTKRNYAKYGKLQIERGIVIDWVCVNFSNTYARLHLFLDRLVRTCKDIDMHFSVLPMKTYHVESAIPNNIAKTFRGVRKSIFEYSSRHQIEGEPIELLLVILPESRDFDAKIEEVCERLGGVYHFCLPSDICKLKSKYLKETAREIKLKVVKRDTFIPFVSEGPTVILGADTSCGNVASVAAPVVWQEFGRYKCLAGPNYELFIQNLFTEPGGMICDLLRPFSEKTEGDWRIIFFRHGIHDLHEVYMNEICRKEVLAIKQACTRLKDGCEPSVTYVVVGGERDKKPSRKDVDLYCQHGFLEGTTPARYHVILDENKITFDVLDSIIIKLCLLFDRQVYSNIPMVPPAYIARHKASECDQQIQDMSKLEIISHQSPAACY